MSEETLSFGDEFDIGSLPLLQRKADAVPPPSKGQARFFFVDDGTDDSPSPWLIPADPDPEVVVGPLPSIAEQVAAQLEPVSAVVPSVADLPRPAVAALRVRPQRRAEMLDWDLVASLANECSVPVADWLRTHEGEQFDSDEFEAFGTEVIGRVVADRQSMMVSATGEPYSLAEAEQLHRAVFNTLFRLGRLQYLMEDERVENILLEGCDVVWMELSDGTMVQAEPIAASDAELEGFIRDIAQRARNPRQFSHSNPSLDMTLPGGYRLAATVSTSRVAVCIRRHRVRDVSLADLVAWGNVTQTAADFLAAAVRAGLSIVVCGQQAVGKTTFMRALINEIPPGEVLGTFESDYELFLDELLDADGQRRHPLVYAWESRQGGEGGVGSETTAEQIINSFRYRLDRQIVGEVRGPEVWSMIKVMESGFGSLSTTHARSARACTQKLVTCAMEHGPSVTKELATEKLASVLDLVVYFRGQTVMLPDGTQRKARWVDEIAGVSLVEGQITTEPIFVSEQATVPAVPCAPPSEQLIRACKAAGWRPEQFQADLAEKPGRAW
ncbi:MAG: Flp pilus assembly complex ATPase component TadA [Propionibacteriaceae bacterium]|nr:Flp pilus assembly complex ATPase component TadA [Propionibacteriaceae bacterium]